MHPNSLSVGVTGGIGAGKSIVCSVFSILGVPVYDADIRARWLMENDPTLRQQIIEKFSKTAFIRGRINRNWLAGEVFSNTRLLKKLNTLVHPLVRVDFAEWERLHQESPYVIKEAALLIETGSHLVLDKIVLVTAPEKERINRILERDIHRNEEQIRDIIQKQLGDEEKERHADYVLKNDGSALLIPQILQLHALFCGGTQE